MTTRPVAEQTIRDQIKYDIQGPCACGKLKCAAPYQTQMCPIVFAIPASEFCRKYASLLIGTTRFRCGNCDEVHKFESAAIFADF